MSIINSLMFSRNDHVVVVLGDVKKNDIVKVKGNGSEVVALEDIPLGHKIAICDIEEGSKVYKYGHEIGTAKNDIKKGQYVHVHNLQDSISNWEESIDYEIVDMKVDEIADEYLMDESFELYGYRRKDGTVGFRNHCLIISTCVCSNQAVRELEFKNRDVVCIENPSGCLILPKEIERINNLLLGLAKNPNVGAVIFVSLGCENIKAKELYEKVKDIKPAAYFVSQEDGSVEETSKRLEVKAREFVELLAKEQKVKVSISDIRLGTKCGASDWTTAAASNPAIGYVSDLIVKNGGTSILGETCGWYGGEEMLISHCRKKETAKKILDAMIELYRRCKFYGKSIEAGNPAPGNIAGGISTLKEKAIGNVMKGGTAPIEGMLDVGEHPLEKGFYVSDGVGIDPASLLQLTSCSANILLYSTGRGSPVGTPIAPAIKLTASLTAAQKYAAHIDVDLSDLVMGETTIAEGGYRLLREVIEVANGKECIAERNRHREYAFPLIMGPM